MGITDLLPAKPSVGPPLPAFLNIKWLPPKSLLAIFPDPFHHEEKVNFPLWLAREIEEFYTGERE